jgi:hypothetical protein
LVLYFLGVMYIQLSIHYSFVVPLILLRGYELALSLLPRSKGELYEQKLLWNSKLAQTQFSTLKLCYTEILAFVYSLLHFRNRKRGLYSKEECNKSARLTSDVGSQKSKTVCPLLFLANTFLLLLLSLLSALWLKKFFQLLNCVDSYMLL